MDGLPEITKSQVNKAGRIVRRYYVDRRAWDETLDQWQGGRWQFYSRTMDKKALDDHRETLRQIIQDDYRPQPLGGSDSDKIAAIAVILRDVLDELASNG